MELDYGTPILKVQSGSHAYGVAQENSDTDYLGIFVAPTKDVLSFGVKQTATHDIEGDIDITWWELTHACKILMKGAFSALPLLAGEVIEATDDGHSFRANRSAFLSKQMLEPVLGFAKSLGLEGFDMNDGSGLFPPKKYAVAYRNLVIAATRTAKGNLNSLILPDCAQQIYHQLYNGGLEAELKRNEWFLNGELENLYRDVTSMMTSLDPEVRSSIPNEPDKDSIQNMIVTIRNHFN